MSDEFMNGTGGDTGNTGTDPHAYTEPEHTNESEPMYSQPEQETTSYYSQQNYNQAQYDPNNLGKPDYSNMNYNQNQQGYNQQSYNQAGYGQPNYNQQPYGQPGMVQKSDSNGFGIASLVLGIISIFTFFCCINYILAITAIILGAVQLVRSSQKGLAIGGIVTAGISILGSIIFWIFVSVAGAEELEPMQQYMEEYIQEYEMKNGDAF